MLVRLGLKPFNDYWITCYYNKILTILTSIEPSYKISPYLNDYHYDVQLWGTAGPDENSTLFNHLCLQPMRMFREQYLQGIFTYQPLHFRDEENCLEILKTLILQKEIIQVGVDLFYWLPNSMSFGVNHWHHTAVIDGFDDEKKVFYAFDEDNSGYDAHEIPEERFLSAIKNCNLDPHGDILKIASPIRPYILSINDVVSNAKRLVEELSTMKTDPFWLLADEDFDKSRRRDVIAIHLYQISNRHKANGILFRLKLNEYCDSELINQLVQRSGKLQNGWLIVRSQLLIVYKLKTDRSRKIADVNDACKRLFSEEIEMWDTLIENICIDIN